MSNRNPIQKQDLEQLHRQLFKNRRDDFPDNEAESLEQPYVDEIVDSITSDSTFAVPKFSQKDLSKQAV
jgi:hypothetical protein